MKLHNNQQTIGMFRSFVNLFNRESCFFIFLVLAFTFIAFVVSMPAIAEENQSIQDILKKMQELQKKLEKNVNNLGRMQEITKEMQKLSKELQKAQQKSFSIPKLQLPETKAGDEIKVELQVDLKVRGHKSASETLSDGSAYNKSVSITGGATISAKFSELAMFPIPKLPGGKLPPGFEKMPVFYVPRGSFSQYVFQTNTTSKRWHAGTYRPPVGQYVLPGRRKSPAGWQRSTYIDGIYGNSIWHGKKTNKTLYESPSFYLEKKPADLEDVNTQGKKDLMQYTIYLSVPGQLTEVVNSGNSHDGLKTKSKTSKFGKIDIKIKGTFQKDQLIIPITEKNIEWTGWIGSSEIPDIKISATGFLRFVSDDPGLLSVKPMKGFDSSGPDKKGNFNPASKTYILENRGKSSLSFKIVKDKDWLDVSATKGELAPGSSTKIVVSINEKAKQLDEKIHVDMLKILNVTNGKGSTSRKIALDVGEEQTWYIKLTGKETDDMGGKVMRIKMQEIWKLMAVNYGVRFDYKLGAVFTIKKKKGKWVYQKGKITEAGMTYVPDFDPDIFFIKKYECKNKYVVSSLKGTSLNGEMVGEKVRLFWPYRRPVVIVYNKLKLKHNFKDESHKGYSANYFISDQFLDMTWTHRVPLRNGHLPPLKQLRSGYVNKYRLDKRKPIHLYYQYFLKRLD